MGQAALQSPSRVRRHKITVSTPCASCRFSGLCLIEDQIEENLILEVMGIGRAAMLELLCSEFEPADHDMHLHATWSEERRAKFAATIAERKTHG